MDEKRKDDDVLLEDVGKEEIGAAGGAQPMPTVTPPPDGNPIYKGAAPMDPTSGGSGPVSKGNFQPDKINLADLGASYQSSGGGGGPDPTEGTETDPNAPPQEGWVKWGNEWISPDEYEERSMAEWEAEKKAKAQSKEPLSEDEVKKQAPHTPYTDTTTSGRSSSRGGVMGDQADQFVQDWLSSPSRYDIDVVQQSMDAIRSRMDEIRRKGFISGQEYLAGMGTLGGTRAAELQDMRRAEYDIQEQEQLSQLQREMAMTQGEDRARAMNAMMQMLGFRENQYQFDEDLGFRNKSLLEQARMFAEEMGFRRDELTEGSRQFDEDLGYRRERGAADDEYRRDELDWKKDASIRNDVLNFVRSMGLDGLPPQMVAKILADLGLGDYSQYLGNNNTNTNYGPNNPYRPPNEGRGDPYADPWDKYGEDE